MGSETKPIYSVRFFGARTLKIIDIFPPVAPFAPALRYPGPQFVCWPWVSIPPFPYLGRGGMPRNTAGPRRVYRKASAPRDAVGSAPDAVGSAPLGPFPSEVSRQTSEPIREAPPGGPSEELFSCAHPVTDLFSERLDRVLLADASSDYPRAARHVPSSVELCRKLSAPPPNRSQGLEDRIFVHVPTRQLRRRRETFRSGAG